MSRLTAGVRSYRSSEYPRLEGLLKGLAGGQTPNALFITCSDSRVDPTRLTNSQPGDLFVLENAGNIVPPAGTTVGGEAATVEYAVKALRVPEIVVCGHERCGAMGGLMAPEGLGELPRVADWLTHSTPVRETVRAKHPDVTPEEAVSLAVKENALLQLTHLRTYDAVAEAEAAGDLALHAWTYDFVTGEVVQHDPNTGEWTSLA